MPGWLAKCLLCRKSLLARGASRICAPWQSRVAGNEAVMKAAVEQEKSLRSPSELAEAGLIGRDRIAALQDVAARYAVAITPAISRPDRSGRSGRSDRAAIRARCSRADRRSQERAPIRSATMPTARSKGIVHRYPDRVLLKLVNACAVYCRFCFRREMVGPGRGRCHRTRSRPRSITSAPRRKSGK